MASHSPILSLLLAVSRTVCTGYINTYSVWESDFKLMFFKDKSSDHEQHDGGCIIIDREGKGYMKTEALHHYGIPIKLGGQEK